MLITNLLSKAPVDRKQRFQKRIPERLIQDTNIYTPISKLMILPNSDSKRHIPNLNKLACSWPALVTSSVYSHHSIYSKSIINQQQRVRTLRLRMQSVWNEADTGKYLNFLHASIYEIYIRNLLSIRGSRLQAMCEQHNFPYTLQTRGVNFSQDHDRLNLLSELDSATSVSTWGHIDDNWQLSQHPINLTRSYF